MKMNCPISTVVFLLTVTFFAFGSPTAALAGKAKFSATVTPATLNLQVSPNGVISGQKTVNVSISRQRVGASAACNKIRTVEVLRSLDSLGEPVLEQYTPNPARCYFDTTLRVTPFPDEEIAGVCRGATGTRTLRADGLVTAWNGLPDAANGPDYLRRMHRNGGTGGPGPKSQTRIAFAANVQCGAQSSVGGVTPPPPPAGNSGQCDLSGTWGVFSATHAGPFGSWKLDKLFTRQHSPSRVATVYRARQFSGKGEPITARQASMTQVGAEAYLFSSGTSMTGNPPISFQATELKVFSVDSSCQKLVQREAYSTDEGKVVRGSGSSYVLERLGAATPQRSGVGAPTRRVPGAFPTRKAPALPGSGFKDKVPQPSPIPNWGK